MSRHAVDGWSFCRYRLGIYSPLDQPPGLRRGFAFQDADGTGGVWRHAT